MRIEMETSLYRVKGINQIYSIKERGYAYSHELTSTTNRMMDGLFFFGTLCNTTRTHIQAGILNIF